MSFRIAIGQLCAIYGITQRAARYYDQIGLVHAERSRDNVRLFDARNRMRLQITVQLRRAGLPLAEIRRLLDLADTDGEEGQTRAILDALTRRLKQVEAEIPAVRGAMAAFGGDVPCSSAWQPRREMKRAT
jgi:DNA-binding transcriptional MerR regulator